MSSSGSRPGRGGALGVAAAALFNLSGRGRSPGAGSGATLASLGPEAADREEWLLGTPPSDAQAGGSVAASGAAAGRAPSLSETAALVERITLEADLRNALAAGDLVLRYQPIVDLASGRIIAFETLCRWRHWSRGLLGPAHFMPLAEESGLIVPLGAWVLQESTRRLAVWRGRLSVGDLDVTVNLSAAELRDRGLVDRTAAALDAAGLPAERLVVEVNESAAYADPEEPANRNLRALADLGVGFAVDDVGAPYPGNPSGRPEPDGWLWQLPLRLLKVDRRITAALASDRSGRVLADAVGLAADRRVPAVAKGVETPEQLARLYRLGCPAGQGFLFARPMDPTDAEAYLRRLLRADRSSA